MAAELTEKELHVMEHATGWNSREPLFRNHFVTGEGSDDWETIQGLCARKMMRMSRGPSELSGGDPVFQVTQDGIAELQARKPRSKAT